MEPEENDGGGMEWISVGRFESGPQEIVLYYKFLSCWGEDKVKKGFG